MTGPIGVDSLTELYTLILGWHQYNNLWLVLTSTGLVFLPFLGILFRHFIEPVKSQKPRAASQTSLQRIEMDLFLMLAIVVLAGQPLVTIQTEDLQFVNLCKVGQKTQNESSVSPLKSVTVFKNAHQAKVPVWWYGVMAFSSGFTYALKTTLPCMADVRMMHSKINMMRISDPLLIAEIQQFQTICYYPAYEFALFGPEKDKEQLKGLIEKYTPQELGWIGSKIFLELSGPDFYEGRKAKEYGGHATPTCKEWWLGNPHQEGGLYGKLKAIVEFEPEFFNLYPELPSEQTKAQVYEAAIRNLVKNEIGNGPGPLFFSQNDFMKGGSGGSSWFSKTWNKSMGFFGLLYDAMSKFPMVYVTQEVAYVVQALLLMGLYLMLPIGLVFSGYSVKFLVLASTGIFTLKFMAYLFHVAAWLDQNLLIAMRPDSQDLIEGTVGALANSAESLKIELLITGLYFLFPMLMVALMGWAGINLGNSLQAAYDKIGGTSSTLAQSGGGAAKLAGAGLKLGQRALSKRR